jgi:hypothetical protein
VHLEQLLHWKCVVKIRFSINNLILNEHCRFFTAIDYLFNNSFLLRFQLTVLNFPFSDSFRYSQIDISYSLSMKAAKETHGKLDKPFPIQNSFIKRQNLFHKSTFSQSFFLYFYSFDVWWHQIIFSKKKVTALTFLIWLRRREKEFFNIIWFDWKAISWLLQSIVRLQPTFYRMYCKEIFIWSS